MALGRLVEIVSRLEEERAGLVAEFLRSACGKFDVVLFGSRARGRRHGFSDWDLAVFYPCGEYRVESAGFGQVFWIPTCRVWELLEWSMVILDIYGDGVFLCGRGDAWQFFKRAAAAYVERKRLARTDAGWAPARL